MAGKLGRAGCRGVAAGLAFVALAAIPACRKLPPARTLHPRDLETADAAALRQRRRAVASDAVRMLPAYRPLGPRLGLLTIHTRAEWEALRAAASEIGPCPALEGGCVVVIASHAGLPVDGQWPVELRTVRRRGELGLAEVRFAGGSYLPDDTTYLEAALVPGLRAVVMVDVNGARFYPRCEPSPHVARVR